MLIGYTLICYKPWIDKDKTMTLFFANYQTMTAFNAAVNRFDDLFTEDGFSVTFRPAYS